MWRQLAPAFRITLVLTVLTGLIYPGITTVVCQLILPHQANGSLVSQNGHVVGSSLLAQSFANPAYFHPRPSAANFDASASAASNLGPTSQKLMDRVKTDAAKFRQDNPGFTGPIPSDAITTSASGLDPHISPAFAESQVARVASARHVAVDQVRSVVSAHTESRQMGFLGEPRVNVLELNLDLNRQFPTK
jgi:potassium-transporting ATPase KdpC subunit